MDVPEPSTVTLRLNNPLPAAPRLDEPQAQLVENLLEELPFLRRQVASGLELEERQDLDHLRRPVEVRLDRLPGQRIREVAEVDRGRARQRQHERRKGQLGFGRLIGHWNQLIDERIW